MSKRAVLDTDGEWIFVKFFRHWRSGKIIYAPPGKAFRFRKRK